MTTRPSVTPGGKPLGGDISRSDLHEYGIFGQSKPASELLVADPELFDGG